jgi:hypothetical protein
MKWSVEEDVWYPHYNHFLRGEGGLEPLISGTTIDDSTTALPPLPNMMKIKNGSVLLNFESIDACISSSTLINKILT